MLEAPAAGVAASWTPPSLHQRAASSSSGRRGRADVSYHHDAGAALRAAVRGGGLAVLLAPVTVESVLDLAADGVRMPRKSTSFGPKPRTGLVLRTFDGWLSSGGAAHPARTSRRAVGHLDLPDAATEPHPYARTGAAARPRPRRRRPPPHERTVLRTSPRKAAHSSASTRGAPGRSRLPAGRRTTRRNEASESPLGSSRTVGALTSRPTRTTSLRSGGPPSPVRSAGRAAAMTPPGSAGSARSARSARAAGPTMPRSAAAATAAASPPVDGAPPREDLWTASPPTSATTSSPWTRRCPATPGSPPPTSCAATGRAWSRRGPPPRPRSCVRRWRRSGSARPTSARSSSRTSTSTTPAASGRWRRCSPAPRSSSTSAAPGTWSTPSD